MRSAVAALLLLLAMSACGNDNGSSAGNNVECPPVATDSERPTDLDPGCVTGAGGRDAAVTETWQGSYEAAATQSGGACGGTRFFTGTVEFEVENGQISGTVEQVYESGDMCYGNTPSFPITGTMTDDAITIVIQDGEYLTGDQPIPKTSAEHAETTVAFTLGVVDWATTWSLDCVEGCA